MKVWILTSEYNEYDQHGEYFEKLFFKKPKVEDLEDACEYTKEAAQELLTTGGGRKNYENQWYYLREYDSSL